MLPNTRKILGAASIAAVFLTGSTQFASAMVIDVTVAGTSNPFISDATTNPSMPYNQNGSTGPIVVNSLDFSSPVTITALSGAVDIGGGYDPTYASGGTVSSGGTVFYPYYNPFAPVPGQYISGGSSNLSELLGAFANAQGTVLSLFVVGSGGTFSAPVGTTELLLGINDQNFGDNTGAYMVEVSDAAPGTVPLPASAPMFGAALIALGAMGYGLKRKAKAAA